MSRLDRHLCAAAGHAADADEPPDGSGAAALPLLADELVRTRSRQAARAKLWRRRDVAARGVFARGASRHPLLGCACLRRPLSMWPTAASSCRRARTTTSLPGRGAGRLLAHRRDDWYLSRSCPATGPCRSPPLTCPCAQLASRAAHRCSPGSLCARATQGSETLLCAAGLTRLFGSCAYWYMRGIHRWCGWPQAGISAGR